MERINRQLLITKLCAMKMPNILTKLLKTFKTTEFWD